MKLVYTKKEDSNNPIILINGLIGKEVLSNQFISEINYLESIGHSNVTVEINTYGGDVATGLAIYNAISTSTMNTTTVNVGLAFSTGSWLLQAGDKRISKDYAFGMIHNMKKGDGSEDENTKKASVKMINTLLTNKTEGQTETIKTLMNNEAWLDAEEMLELGLIDEIENTGETVVVSNEYTTRDAFTLFNQFNYNHTTNSNSMKKVAAFLQLNNEASEDAILAAFKSKVDSLDNAFKGEKAKVEEKEVELGTLSNKVTALESEINGYKEKENEAAKVAAETFVNNLVALGKLKDDESLKNEWTKQYISNPTFVENNFDSVVGTPNVTVGSIINQTDEVKEVSIAQYRAELN